MNMKPNSFLKKTLALVLVLMMVIGSVTQYSSLAADLEEPAKVEDVTTEASENKEVEPQTLPEEKTKLLRK